MRSFPITSSTRFLETEAGVSPGSPCIQYSEVSSLACLHFRSLSMARPMSRSSTACTDSDLNVRPDLFRTLAKNWPYRVAQLE